ncbi:uncharacterized protein DS421_18g621730 [Arachis hypogaea]|nr:uncharacterized protein DS421_18g621730 [Arachis hypogaea]
MSRLKLFLAREQLGTRNRDYTFIICHNFDTTNQQVHWVVQVIPYVSKGRIPRRLLV